ncbi:MAG: formylglycine-generating enzyme family protein [Thermodesulfobacteriota bacterium]|nr:formylglycine-generating enzyme family protein [Thermodesulfobacteriota bacterium]
MKKRIMAIMVVVAVALGLLAGSAQAWMVDEFIPLKKDGTPARLSGGGRSFTNDLGMEFVWIAPGTFMMGSPENEKGRDSDEKQHKVTLTKGFYMQTTEVTIGQYRTFLKATHKEDGVDWDDDDDCPLNNDGNYSLSGNKFGKDNAQPMVEVSWHGAKAFAEWLSKKTGKTFRLPTEAEWEYACRAGSTTAFCFGERDSGLDNYAWYRNNAEGRTHPVAQKQPNAWGLYDMHGNVWEWCSDWYGDYPSGNVTDPEGPSSDSYRVYRGGSWDGAAQYCRSAYRGRIVPGARDYDLGFRLVCPSGR